MGPAKALSNIHKHGVTFDQAATVFLDGLALTIYDTASSNGEERWFTLGFDAGGASSWPWPTPTKRSGRAAHGCASSLHGQRPNASGATMKMNLDRQDHDRA
jgi:hypothetical protein